VSSAAPVRVLHVLLLDTLAGTELMVASLVLRSDPAAVEHELATLQPPGPIAARVSAGARPVWSLGGGGGGLAGASLRLARLLRTREYDVVNAYGLKASVIARLLTRLLRPAATFVCGVRALHVTEVERLDSRKARLASLVERLLSPLVDVYDSNSRAAIGLLEGLGIGADRFVHIPNGLDLAEWAPRDGARPEGDVPVIVCAARFVERKRHSDLLEALAILAREGRPFRAVLAGRGETLERMRALAASLGLSERVELPGAVGPEEMRDLLAGAAVACLPSAWEGMPGSLMEAMASGVAVVGTDVAGTNELVVDGESGLLAPAYDPPALARALAALLDDPGLRRRLGAGARSRMEQCFSLEVMLAAKERLYRELGGRAAA
jgi:glycosyltransferase involved in cell wall biosynthesis